MNNTLKNMILASLLLSHTVQAHDSAMFLSDLGVRPNELEFTANTCVDDLLQIEERILRPLAESADDANTEQLVRSAIESIDLDRFERMNYIQYNQCLRGLMSLYARGNPAQRDLIQVTIEALDTRFSDPWIARHRARIENGSWTFTLVSATTFGLMSLSPVIGPQFMRGFRSARQATVRGAGATWRWAGTSTRALRERAGSIGRRQRPQAEAASQSRAQSPEQQSELDLFDSVLIETNKRMQEQAALARQSSLPSQASGDDLASLMRQAPAGETASSIGRRLIRDGITSTALGGGLAAVVIVVPYFNDSRRGGERWIAGDLLKATQGLLMCQTLLGVLDLRALIERDEVSDREALSARLNQLESEFRYFSPQDPRERPATQFLRRFNLDTAMGMEHVRGIMHNAGCDQVNFLQIQQGMSAIRRMVGMGRNAEQVR